MEMGVAWEGAITGIEQSHVREGSITGKDDYREVSVREGLWTAEGRALQAAVGRRKAEGSARDHDGSPKIILVGPTFYFFGVNTGNYWRWSLFCLRISIWVLANNKVLERKYWKLLEMLLIKNN